MNNTYEQIDIFNSPDVDALRDRLTYCTSMDTPVPPISQILLDFRRCYGYTQATLSKLLQIPKRTIENWETGKSTPPPYVVWLIRFALNVYAFIGPSL